MNKFALTLGWLLTHAATHALAQPVTVEFSGEVTQGFNVAPGTPLVGTFTYDPRQGTYQSSARPIISFDIGAAYSFRLTAFSIGIRDNYSLNSGDRPIDGLTILFTHPSLDSGAGGLELSSFNTGLFDGTGLPWTLPALDQFDASRSLSFHRDVGDITVPGNYWAVGTRIDRLAVVPEPSAGLLLGGAWLLACVWRAQRIWRLRHSKVG
jgi:hypothetical protein